MGARLLAEPGGMVRRRKLQPAIHTCNANVAGDDLEFEKAIGRAVAPWIANWDTAIFLADFLMPPATTQPSPTALPSPLKARAKHHESRDGAKCEVSYKYRRFPETLRPRPQTIRYHFKD